jgi:hypothetical protein
MAKTPRSRISTRLATSVALLASLAATQAHAASYEANVVIGKLSFEVTDLTPNDSSVAGYGFNANAINPFIGSFTASSVNPIGGASPAFAPTFAFSNPLTVGDYGSPFDTFQNPAASSAHGQTASVAVNGNALSASVLTTEASGYFGYAEALIGAVNLGNGMPGAAQNTMVLAAHTQVTILASASLNASAIDASVCPGCDAQFTGYAALVGGEQLQAYILANQSDGALRQAALQAAGISFIGVEQGTATESNGGIAVNDFLSLTFRNDTDSEQSFGFVATGWLNANSVPAAPVAAPVPEPETAGLALVGLLVSAAAWRRRRA